MPEPVSPGREALVRLLRRNEVRFGLSLLVVLALVAVYAPFLAGDVALVAHDRDGWHLPLLRDLFNRNSFVRPHDLLFNVLALVLPLAAVAAAGLRRWLRMRTLAVATATVVVFAWAAVSLPLPHGGDSWEPLVPTRPRSAFVFDRVTERRTAGETVRAVFPPIPHRPDATYGGAVLKPIGTINPETGRRFWLGTDSAGKDVLAQMLFGARISLTVGIFATALSMLIGVVIGGISGYFGGRIDLLLQRLVEIMMCFPTFILILVTVAMLGRDIFVIMTVIGVTGWAGTARLVRGEFLAQSVRDYVAAAEALGLPRWRIMFRHILPNTLTPLIISATFGVAGAVLAESGLAFVGLGDPSASSWGTLLEQGRLNIAYGWLIWCPGLAVFALVSALNLVGNGLREVLDPRSTR